MLSTELGGDDGEMDPFRGKHTLASRKANKYFGKNEREGMQTRLQS